MQLTKSLATCKDTWFLIPVLLCFETAKIMLVLVQGDSVFPVPSGEWLHSSYNWLNDRMYRTLKLFTLTCLCGHQDQNHRQQDLWSPRPKPQTARPVVTKTIHVQDTEAVYPDLPVWSPRPKPQTARPEVIETKTTDRKTCGHQDQNHRQQDLWSPRPKTRQYSTDVKKLCHCFMHIILVLLC